MDPRQEIIDIGRTLHEQGLLVRTWGNISCRIDKDHILITPSGIQYEDLTPDMIAGTAGFILKNEEDMEELLEAGDCGCHHEDGQPCGHHHGH